MSLRIEHAASDRSSLPTVECRIAYSDGHRAAMAGKPIPEDIYESNTAESRSYKNGYEAGKRAAALKGDL